MHESLNVTWKQNKKDEKNLHIVLVILYVDQDSTVKLITKFVLLPCCDANTEGGGGVM